MANSHIVFRIMRLLRPHRVAGLNKIRLGRFFDGGYVMMDAFDSVTAAYSFGINNDASWDLDIANRGIPVFQYDHTIDALPTMHSLFSWAKLGIGGITNPDVPLETIPNLISKNGHQDHRNLIMKCDVEGHEWQVFAAMPGPCLEQFKQIVVEFHDFQRLDDIKFAEELQAALVNLTRAHCVVHVHANNWGSWAIIGGVPIPSVIEITLMRRDVGACVVSDEIFPTGLDMPCNPERPDFYLGRFAFD